MNYKANSSTLVIAGKWNKYLLNPQWVAQNLFQVENINVQISSALLDAPPRFINDNIILVVTNDYVHLTATNPEEDENLKNVENIAIRLVSTLKYTPVVGLGMNFVFQLNEDESDQLNDFFTLKDNESIIDNGLVLDSGTIRRGFRVDDHVLNLSIKKGDNVEVELNHHFEFKSSESIESYLNGEKFIEIKNRSLELMNSIYNKTLENG